MMSLIRAIVDRLTAMLVTAAAQEAESVVLARSAERLAELARLAEVYERDGQVQSAEHLRRQLTSVDPASPMASVLPVLDHMQVPEASAPQPIAFPETQREMPPLCRSRR